MMKQLPLLGATLLTLFSASLHAGSGIASLTLDNDYFINRDDGYTNGLYFTLYDRSGIPAMADDSTAPEHSVLVSPLMWSMPTERQYGSVNALKFGQSMFTPADLTLTEPDPNDIPYSAMLSLTNSYLVLNQDHADVVHSTLGIVGPAALGKESQKLVHQVLGSDDPQGWGSQLHNELVFQVGRGRIWRHWASELDNMDLLTSLKGSVGTIRSAASSSLIVRYGRDLKRSFGSFLLLDSRTTNPVAVSGEWYVYAGLQAEYVFNEIFMDGNTFRDSASVNYDHSFIGLNFGVAYSWGRSSLTFAVNHSDLLQPSKDRYSDETRYGTLTYAWQF
ncbi:hypothetical protein MAQ5080_00689 [Marinomonas aquimarina]|uniref:Lipid A deacylase LpxR family protein n=1 Tax=Marinomonas aquimarina TaxID=295068 RepID=A0A1A8T4U2_9GAMM|nr:lipid A deacylase LpxR family protein [Marinomonas aquimarina]SBS26977.1 hypothetical protein MAQ5080_00689 [Marinomonas aquimarina]